MKININFNMYFAITIWVICLTLLVAFFYVLDNADNYYAYEKYISDNLKGNIDFYYSCDSTFYTAFYNCSPNLQLKNLTGYYCNGTIICQNSYKIK
jgi:hypothetical protein